MKILQLRFKNLNSLHGEWFIDFTVPEYTSNGIFAITGPTGAGKSTILDAVCLALYGRTPRLKSITKSGNEIMSRRTGECFAEVMFETLEGRFISHWSQGRARKKPDGNLMDSKHEITDATSKKVIETKKREVADAIEKRTGMDFDRFTRSILLAQGGFTAFLQANPDDRAPILEDITGTEIYTAISIKVHERHRSEREKLDILKAETAGIIILDEQEKARLADELGEKQKHEKKLSSDNSETASAINWLNTVSGLEKELTFLEKEAERISSEIHDFEGDRKKLVNALAAGEIEGEYVFLQSKRKQQKDDFDAIGLCEKQLPEKQELLSQFEAEQEKTGGNLSVIKEKKKTELEIIKKVRAFDLRISEREKSLGTVFIELQSLEKQISDLEKKKQETEKKCDVSQKNLAKAEIYIATNLSDAELVSELAGIKAAADNLEKNLKKRTSLTEKLEKSFKKLDSTSSEVKTSENKCGLLKQESESAKAESHKLSDSMKNILQDRQISHLRTEHEMLKDRLKLLETASGLFSSIESDSLILKETETAKIALYERTIQIRSEINSLSEKKGFYEREAGHLEERTALLNRIRDLESERLRLEDEKPCPLCGSLHHPYAEGNIPESGDTEKALVSAKALLKKTVDDISSLNVMLAGLSKELEHLEAKITELSLSIANNNAKYAENLLQAGIKNHDGSSLSYTSLSVDDLLFQKSWIIKNIVSLSEILTQADKLDILIKSALIKERESLNSFVESEKLLEQAKYKKEVAEADHERDKEDLNQTDKLCEDLNADLLAIIKKYGIGEIPDPWSGILIVNLENRLKNWLKIQKQKAETEKQINEFSAELKGIESSVKAREENLEARKINCEEIKKACLELKTDRKELYGDRSPDSGERAMDLLVANTEEMLKKASLKTDSASRILHELKTRIKSLYENTENRKNEINQLETTFMSSLKKSGFNDEDGFIASRMSAHERERLADLAKKLDTGQAEIQARMKDRRDKLDSEIGKNITSKTIEELEAEHFSISEAIKAVSHEIGGLKQKLSDNENAVLKYREKLLLIEAQKAEFSRWNELHDLIGSSDGKKFRNFAQGLTFEIMVSHANRQLERMTDRYLLIRDKNQPLELNVVDNYQAGEVRSTKNLSGGESFIVSLSLALGLSGMASRKVRVDSLFLDEGFGTLDEEALETALEALSSLQQTGKLIGIISHVSALKERISSRIQVKPVSGGRSVISGPGCIKKI